MSDIIDLLNDSNSSHSESDNDNIDESGNASDSIVTGSAKINHLVAQKSPSFFKYILP